MPKPLLHLGDIRLMIERIGGGGRAQRVRADQKPQLPRIAPHQSIDAVGGNRALQPSGAVVADRPEQRAAVIEAVPGGVEVVVDQSMRARIQRQIARLAAFAGDFQMRHAFARVPEILHPQLAQFLAPQRMEQQGRQNRAVAPALDGVLAGRCEQVARLVVADRRRLAFAAFGLRPLDAFAVIKNKSRRAELRCRRVGNAATTRLLRRVERYDVLLARNIRLRQHRTSMGHIRDVA